jgi:hypothetical protein
VPSLKELIKSHLMEIITDACLFWLPIDLLYLFYAGGWDDPNKMILYAELTLLYTLPLFAVWRIYKYIKGEKECQ